MFTVSAEVHCPPIYVMKKEMFYLMTTYVNFIGMQIANLVTL